MNKIFFIFALFINLSIFAQTPNVIQYRKVVEFKDPASKITITLPSETIQEPVTNPNTSNQENKVYTNIPANVSDLIETQIKLNKVKKESDGFRIQILSTSNQTVAGKARIAFLDEHDDMDIYTVYDRPYYKLRVGDFVNKKDAEKVAMQLKKKYPAFVVPEKIKTNKRN